ncbi:MAG: RNA polymerase sigma factor [Clostridia bacterium]|nr:RNA polymerase sigma factor [Clostridia bacterium]
MIGFDRDFEKQCGEYLEYLYRLAEVQYNDCPDIDALVQDTLTALIIKVSKGEKIEYPKGFLSAVLKNKYNAWLREKYKAELVEYYDGTNSETYNEIEEKENAERKNEEYESVRREIGRLIRIYRDVTVRHYVHGQTVEQISKELNIPRGTVLSRLSAARDQIKEGVKNMEKYSQISYEPKTASIGIWGNGGLSGEPFSLMRSNIEANILNLAYENPVSIRGIADTMGMPSAYIEPIIEFLIRGELMGKTAGGLVYTRCFVQRYEDSFGCIPAQEKLADKYAVQVWETVWKHLEPLTLRDEFAAMSDKQKATMILFVINQMLNEVLRKSRPDSEHTPKQPPDRPNAGRWLATVTVYDHNQKRDNPYDGSGPVYVGYSSKNDGKFDCQMLDCQSLFGDAHWAYNQFKYRCTLHSILRFYASLLPCNVKTDNELIYELIPEFEKLCILKRDEFGKIRLDIPALTFNEVTKHWNPVCEIIKKELFDLLSDDLKKLWSKTKNRVPRHVDEADYFIHAGAMGAYVKAQLLAIVNKKLLPYPVVVGKTPLIYIAYRKKDM